MARQLVSILCAAMVSIAWGAPSAKDLKPTLSIGDDGEIWFASTGSLVRHPDDLRLSSSGPLALSGTLQFPKGTGPFPALILAHGCAGITAVENMWAAALRDWGYATFLLDSFSGRGLSEVCTDALALTGEQRTADAYGALRILATHPKVDARRVALMGFSHGGILALAAATTWAKQTFAPGGKLAFRAFVPFYPSCVRTYPELEHISAPVRIHIGELDDWTPALPCAQLVETLKASGQNAAISVYPGAGHGFDNPQSEDALRLPAAENYANCRFHQASILGPFPSAGERSTCVTKGATVGGRREARERALETVRLQLKELLR